MNGHEWAGSILGVGGIGGIVATFILGRNNPSSDDHHPKDEPKQSKKKKK